MYTSFSIRNFRGFRDFTMNDLARINLIAGKNNVGKTSLVEAIWVHTARYNPELILRLNAFRGLPKIEIELPGDSGTPWEPIFNEFDTTKAVIIASRNGDGEGRSTIRVLREPEELKKLGRLFNRTSTATNRYPSPQNRYRY